MKIMAATTKGGLDDLVSEVFGRCATFTMVEVEGKDIKGADVVPNQFAGGTGGVGIQVAQMAVKEKVRAVLAGRFGPNATEVLARSGIEMVPMAGVPVRQAVEKFLSGEALAPPGNPAAVPQGAGGGAGPGAGAGIGSGMGGGMGRGMGMGGGGGRGRGGRGGGGMGRCRYPAFGPSPQGQGRYGPSPFPPGSITKEQERQMLEAEKQALEARLEEIRKKMEGGQE